MIPLIQDITNMSKGDIIKNKYCKAFIQNKDIYCIVREPLEVPRIKKYWKLVNKKYNIYWIDLIKSYVFILDLDDRYYMMPIQFILYNRIGLQDTYIGDYNNMKKDLYKTYF